MTPAHDKPRRFSHWTIEIKVWKLLVALVILPILVLWLNVVHQDDEILALIRNEVVTWRGPVAYRLGVLMGPFREPWEFGYLMIDPAAIER